MKIDKRTIISSVTVVSLAILGFASYTIFSLVGADTFQDSACKNITGNAWKNCAANAQTWKWFLRDTSNANFIKIINNLKKDAGLIIPTK